MNEGTPKPKPKPKPQRAKWWSRARPQPAGGEAGPAGLAGSAGPTEANGETEQSGETGQILRGEGSVRPEVRADARPEAPELVDAEGDFELERPRGPVADDTGDTPPSGEAALGDGDGDFELQTPVPPVPPVPPGGVSGVAGAGGVGGSHQSPAPQSPGAQAELSAPQPPTLVEPSVRSERPLHDPDPYNTPPYGHPGPWAPAPPVQHPGVTQPRGASTQVPFPQQGAAPAAPPVPNPPAAPGGSGYADPGAAPAAVPPAAAQPAAAPAAPPVPNPPTVPGSSGYADPGAAPAAALPAAAPPTAAPAAPPVPNQPAAPGSSGYVVPGAAPAAAPSAAVPAAPPVPNQPAAPGSSGYVVPGAAPAAAPSAAVPAAPPVPNPPTARGTSGYADPGAPPATVPPAAAPHDAVTAPGVPVPAQHTPPAAPPREPAQHELPSGQPPLGAPADLLDVDPWARYDPWSPVPAASASRGAVGSGRRRRGGQGIAAGAIVLALVSGGVGGAVGIYLDRHTNRVDVSLPQASREPVGRSATGVAAIAARALPSVVTLHVSGDQEEDTGTGFVLDTEGHILTNNHVVQPAGSDGEIEATFDGGKTVKAEVVGRDSGYDLAVVQVTGVDGLTPMALGNSDNVRVGDPVVAIGAPFDLAGTVTSGIISAKDRPITAGGDTGEGGEVSYVDALQTDAPINPGNSGGPLLDAQARVVGINSAMRAADDGSTLEGGQAGSIGLGFAIPVNQAKRVAEELINTGHATHPVIGITLDMAYAGDGARVGTGSGAVVAGGPGDRAGIEPGDVVTAVDGAAVHTGSELIVRTRAHRPGDSLRLTLTRDGEVRTVTLVLGSSDDD